VKAFASLCTIESPDSELGEIPFAPYSYQIEFWRAILEELAKLDAQRRPDIIRCEKSRQMGLSWAAALFILWSLSAWGFVWRALVLSYNFDLVDDGGSESTTDSLFGKVRFMWERLPDELRAPLSFRLGHIVNKQTHASVIAKTTNASSKQSGSGGRGGSYRYGFWDEAAFGVHSRQVMAGFSRAARVKVLWSTANGKTGTWGFLKYGAKRGVRHLRIHWSEHPVYGKDKRLVDGKWTSPWYEEECATMTDEDIARELDISDAASVQGRAFPEFSVDAHVRPGLVYEGGALFSGWDFGIRASVFSIHEQRPNPEGGLEVVTLAAVEIANATADVLVEAFRGEIERLTGNREHPCRNFGDPAGKARSQLTGTSMIHELGQLGVPIEAPSRLSDVKRRVRTCRLMLQGKELPNGQRVIYAVADEEPGLKWLQECIEQAKWPTDIDGVVRGDPGDLENNEYTHHADGFGYAIEGMYGTTEVEMSKRDTPAHRPVTAGIRQMVF
jgi:hypothetical protein